MNTVLIALLVFSAVFFAMAIGYIVQGKVLKGTCGGLNALFGKGSCEICDKKEDCKFTKNKAPLTR